MLQYFTYSRKSSEDKDRQILSIDAQQSELRSIALSNGLHVVRNFEESKSAKAPGRAQFNEMLRRIELGEADAIISWKLDRLARNFEDGGKIIGLLQRGVIREIRTFERTYLPSDNVLMIAVEFGMANQYVRDLSVNIRRGYREKIRRGVYPSKAPFGYFNEPKLRTIEPHPEKFAKVKRVLELFATGNYTLAGIQHECTKAGLVGERTNKPLKFSTLHQLLKNPFYYGVFIIKGEMHQGVHVPMISKATFDEIQKARVERAKPRQNRKADKGLLFRNFATCGSCGYCITGERHTKKSGLRFLYYRCTHKDKQDRCQIRSYVRHQVFEAEVRRNVELVVLPSEWKERFLAKVETWESESEEKAQNQLARLNSERQNLTLKIDRLNSAFTEGALDISEFREMKNPLVARKVEMDEKIALLSGRKANRLEPLRNWISEANTVENTASGSNWPEMKELLQKVGSNRILRETSLTVSFIKPWNSLAKTTVAARCADSDSARSAVWWRRRELNPCPDDSRHRFLHA